ncbi:NAD(P)-binding protein [bacterium]|nr:NAD(P)-binding protein [bacterium]
MSQYDTGIIGGGLAGLAAAIILSQKGKSVVLFEKNHYPFHKVCGEYLSNESKPFLQQIGLPLREIEPAEINQFLLHHHSGRQLQVKLQQGGMGISRYWLDDKMADLALAHGTVLLQGEKVHDVTYQAENDNFKLEVANGHFTCKTVIGSFGKRSNLDKQLGTEQKATQADNNFVAVKYHLKTEVPVHQIALHLFPQGYAGISRVEDGKTCLCYMTTAGQLKKCGGTIEALEREVLSKNALLAEHLNNSTRLFASPLSIAQIALGPKKQVAKHVLLAGDAAGMISPLSGNGMSMALHTGKLAAQAALNFLDGKSSRSQMETQYQKEWRINFATRVANAYHYQKLFMNEKLSRNTIAALRFAPFITKMLVKSTHGKAF